MIDNRETHETSVSSCEGDKCKPRRCMLPDCIAPTVCHTGTKPFCLARDIYTNNVNLCDCERSANGIGLAGRECDCPAGI